MWDRLRTPCRACYVYMAPGDTVKVRLYFIPNLMSCMDYFCVDRNLVDGESELIRVSEFVTMCWVRWRSEVVERLPEEWHAQHLTRQGRRVYDTLCRARTWRRQDSDAMIAQCIAQRCAAQEVGGLVPVVAPVIVVPQVGGLVPIVVPIIINLRIGGVNPQVMAADVPAPMDAEAEVVHPDSDGEQDVIEVPPQANAKPVEYLEISSDAEEPPVPFPSQHRACDG